MFVKVTLTLVQFAADLYKVRIGEAPNVYLLPDQFFDRTYPTYNLKTLVRDVFQRLSGRGGKPVIRCPSHLWRRENPCFDCAVTSGRTWHLNSNPIPPWESLCGFSGVDPLPQTRVALLPFDKFDVKTGLSVVEGPDGRQQQVKYAVGRVGLSTGGR